MSEYLHGEPGGNTPEDIQAYIEGELRRIEDAVSRNIWEYSYSVVKTSQTIGDTPYVFADATSGAITLTLPEPSTDPMILNVKKTDSSSNAVTLAATSIDGEASCDIVSQYDSVKLYWDQSVWHIV